CLRPDRPRGTQIRDSRRCCRAKHDLARNGTATDRVPHRLGCDTVAAAIHVPFEHMHIFHVAQFRLERKRRTIILWHWSLARCPSVVQECEGRASRCSPCSSSSGTSPVACCTASVRAGVAGGPDG